MCHCGQVGSENNTGPLGDEIELPEIDEDTIITSLENWAANIDDSHLPTVEAVENRIDSKIADIPGAPVTSVNGETGAVNLDSDDISDVGKTHKFTTAAEITKLSGIEANADVTDSANVDAAGAVMNSDYDANTILKSDSDNTPAALTVAEQRLVGRITAGVIEALTAAQVRTLLNVEDGATADLTDAEILALLLNVDGAGSGLDADLLDGHDTAYFQAALGFTAENVANKDTDSTFAANSDTKYPSQKATKTALDTKQPLDPTLSALAAADWAANALPIGSGADALSQVSFAANTFPARASSGNLVPKTITDFILTLLDDSSDSAARNTLGLGTIATQAANNVSLTGGSISGLTALALATGAISAGVVPAPTITKVTNVAASSIQDQQWMRIGNVVTVSGRCTIDPTSASIATEVGISLPIASTTSLFTYVSGAAVCSNAVSLSGGCEADITNNRMAIRFINTGETASKTWHYVFTYRIA